MTLGRHMEEDAIEEGDQGEQALAQQLNTLGGALYIGSAFAGYRHQKALAAGFHPPAAAPGAPGAQQPTVGGQSGVVTKPAPTTLGHVPPPGGTGYSPAPVGGHAPTAPKSVQRITQAKSPGTAGWELPRTHIYEQPMLPVVMKQPGAPTGVHVVPMAKPSGPVTPVDLSRPGLPKHRPEFVAKQIPAGSPIGVRMKALAADQRAFKQWRVAKGSASRSTGSTMGFPVQF